MGGVLAWVWWGRCRCGYIEGFRPCRLGCCLCVAWGVSGFVEELVGGGFVVNLVHDVVAVIGDICAAVVEGLVGHGFVVDFVHDVVAVVGDVWVCVVCRCVCGVCGGFVGPIRGVVSSYVGCVEVGVWCRQVR